MYLDALPNCALLASHQVWPSKPAVAVDVMAQALQSHTMSEVCSRHGSNSSPTRWLQVDANQPAIHLDFC